jgi:site-specific DNA-methyltransferase (adenine-specific)
VKAVPVKAIKPYGRNPRRNDNAVDAVARSIELFGFRQPIVCDMQGVIVVGHTRYKAAMRLGLESVPVVYADLTPEQAKAYRLADNKTGELAMWDYEQLEREMREIADSVDMSEFGLGGISDEIPDMQTLAIPNDTEEKTYKLTIVCDSKEDRNAAYAAIKEAGINYIEMKKA